MKKKILLLVLPFLLLFAFSVKAESVPQVTGLKITKRTLHSITVKWNKIQNVRKFNVLVTKASNSKTVANKKVKKNKAKINKLKPGRIYFVQVSAIVKGEKGEYTEPEEAPTKTVKSITLSACSEISSDNSQNTDKNICWETEGYSKYGYKVVWSKTSEPTYPTRDSDSYQYLSEPKTESANVTAFDGDGTYYVRVCEYTGGACGVYSNEITIDLTEDNNNNDVTAITLTKCNEVSNISDDDSNSINLCWAVEGYSDMGFKLVWSKNSAPEYPTRDGDYYQYYSEPSADEGEITSNDGSGTYYVRVCEYLGGACGVYSNEIEVEL